MAARRTTDPAMTRAAVSAIADWLRDERQARACARRTRRGGAADRPHTGRDRAGIQRRGPRRTVRCCAMHFRARASARQSAQRGGDRPTDLASARDRLAGCGRRDGERCAATVGRARRRGRVVAAVGHLGRLTSPHVRGSPRRGLTALRGRRDLERHRGSHRVDRWRGAGRMHRDLHRELRKVRRRSGAARRPRPAIGMGVATLAAGVIGAK